MVAPTTPEFKTSSVLFKKPIAGELYVTPGGNIVRLLDFENRHEGDGLLYCTVRVHKASRQLDLEGCMVNLLVSETGDVRILRKPSEK